MGSRTAILACLLVSVAYGQKTPAPAQAEGSQARVWNGNLVDATKTECGVEVSGTAQKGACPVDFQTNTFALMLPDGRALKLDEGGNEKAAEALKKSRNGGKVLFDYWKSGKVSKQIRARATGSLTGEVLNVETIRID